jgi:hypothetical protein
MPAFWGQSATADESSSRVSAIMKFPRVEGLAIT